MDRIPLRELSINQRPGRRESQVALRKAGLTVEEIAKRTQCSERTVYRTLKKYDQEGHFEDYPRSGRPQKHTERDDRDITRPIDLGQAMTAVDAARDYNAVRPDEQHLSISSVRKILKEAGLPARVKPRKPALTKAQIAKRYAWAKAMKLKAEAGCLLL